jgi:hypothetical protein
MTFTHCERAAARGSLELPVPSEPPPELLPEQATTKVVATMIESLDGATAVLLVSRFALTRLP